MAGYRLPTTTTRVSSDYADHRRRNPPSSEPGTDYAAPYGSTLYAPGSGKVVDIKTTNSGAMGRFVTIDLDDGRRWRAIHLSAVGVSVGRRVARGTVLGKTGGSAYGSNTGVGSHVHVTLWPTHRYVFTSNGPIDFERYVSQPLGPAQRQVVAAGVNGRSKPTTTSSKTQFLEGGAVGDFDGWVRGESVNSNNVWFRGAHSGDWFWSGGFTDRGTHDLKDLNPPAQPDLSGNQRRAVEAGVNGRSAPNTKAGITSTLAGNVVGDFDAWTRGEAVEGNGVWFRGAYSGAWFWSGGFTDKGTHDLVEVQTTTVDPPIKPLPNRVVRDLSYPGETRAWMPPYAYRIKDGELNVRPGGKIAGVALHHTGGTVDQENYFTSKNDRVSCPNEYLNAAGQFIGMVPIELQPSSTGKDVNPYTVAIEVQDITGGPDWLISDDQHERLAEFIAWLSQLDEYKGIPLDIPLDRDHIKGHNEYGTATLCPGPSMDIDRIVARAKEIVKGDPEVPVEPEPEPEPIDGFVVPREIGEQIRSLVEQAFPIDTEGES